MHRAFMQSTHLMLTPMVAFPTSMDCMHSAAACQWLALELQCAHPLHLDMRKMQSCLLSQIPAHVCMQILRCSSDEWVAQRV